MSPPHFTCPDCGATSHNPRDEAEQYCGRCHVFMDDMARRTVLKAEVIVEVCTDLLERVKAGGHRLPPPSVQRLGEALGALDRLLTAIRT